MDAWTPVQVAIQGSVMKSMSICVMAAVDYRPIQYPCVVNLWHRPVKLDTTPDLHTYLVSADQTVNVASVIDLLLNINQAFFVLFISVCLSCTHYFRIKLVA